MGNPLISVIVPSYKMASFLPSMLDSCFSQDYAPLEVVVMDGASQDGTVEVLESYAQRHPNLRWRSEPDSGPADAVNKGLAEARGEFALIQNADDLFCPGALSAASSHLQAHPEASLVYGDVGGMNDGGEVSYQRQFPGFSWEAFFANSCTLAQGSVLFRRNLALAVGGWNAAYYSCDLAFWLQLAFKAPPVHLPQMLSIWRRHAGQRTRADQFHQIWDGYWRMMRETPELAAAPWRLRRLARASCHLLALRYHPTRNPWAIRWHALLGLALHPSAWRYQPRHRFYRLIPGIKSLLQVRQHWRATRKSR